MTKKSENRMSVRLDEQSNAVLEKAAKAGISKTTFINMAIHGASLTEQRNRRDVQLHLVKLQSILELCTDADVKNCMREEINHICQYLK